MPTEEGRKRLVSLAIENGMSPDAAEAHVASWVASEAAKKAPAAKPASNPVADAAKKAADRQPAAKPTNATQKGDAGTPPMGGPKGTTTVKAAAPVRKPEVADLMPGAESEFIASAGEAKMGDVRRADSAAALQAGRRIGDVAAAYPAAMVAARQRSEYGRLGQPAPVRATPDVSAYLLSPGPISAATQSRRDAEVGERETLALVMDPDEVAGMPIADVRQMLARPNIQAALAE